MRIGTLILLFYLFIVPTILISQINNISEKGYSNDYLIINGPVYYQSNILAQGSPFLYSEGFKKAVIFLCDRKFTKVPINYDLVDQVLVLLHNSKNNLKVPLKVNEVLIDSFRVDNGMFVSASSIGFDMSYPYLQVVNYGETQLFFSYKREFIKRFTQENKYGKISSVKREAFLKIGDDLLTIKSIQELSKYYKGDWKSLKRLIKENKIKLRSSSVDELRDFMNTYNLKN